MKSKRSEPDDELIVVVRELPGIAFFARCQGKQASCTAGADYAIKAVVRKVWPRVPEKRLRAVVIGKPQRNRTMWSVTKESGVAA